MVALQHRLPPPPLLAQQHPRNQPVHVRLRLRPPHRQLPVLRDQFPPLVPQQVGNNVRVFNPKQRSYGVRVLRNKLKVIPLLPFYRQQV